MDYIITHCAPTSIQNELLQALSRPDELTDFLEEVQQRCRFDITSSDTTTAIW